MTVKEMVKKTLRILPFGVQLYRVPRVERAYLIKPKLGAINKAVRKNFADIEAALYKENPGPIYKTEIDWNKQVPMTQGKFLKASRNVHDSVLTKKEKTTPAPTMYTPLKSWKKFEPSPKGNFKQ